MLAGVLAIEGEMVVVVGCWLVLLRRLLRSVEIVVAARLWLNVLVVVLVVEMVLMAFEILAFGVA